MDFLTKHNEKFETSFKTDKDSPDQFYVKDLGTTIMAIVYDGGVMLAADTRTSSGAFVPNRVSDKIRPISKNIFGLTAGSAADSQFLIEQTRSYVSQFEIEYGKKALVKAAVRILQQFQYEYKNHLQSQIIVCGYDDLEGPQIYVSGMGGSVVKQNVAISGSGSAFIYGWVDSNYREGMTKQDAREFLKTAVSLAIFRDNSSGGIIRLMDITKHGFERGFIPHEDIVVPHNR